MLLTLDRADLALLRLTFWEANADRKGFAAALAERVRTNAPGIQARLPENLDQCVREVTAEIEAALMVAHEECRLQIFIEHLYAWYHKYDLLPSDLHVFRESLLLVLESRLVRPLDATRRSAWQIACSDIALAITANGPPSQTTKIRRLGRLVRMLLARVRVILPVSLE